MTTHEPKEKCRWDWTSSIPTFALVAAMSIAEEPLQTVNSSVLGQHSSNKRHVCEALTSPNRLLNSETFWSILQGLLRLGYLRYYIISSPYPDDSQRHDSALIYKPFGNVHCCTQIPRFTRIREPQAYWSHQAPRTLAWGLLNMTTLAVSSATKIASYQLLTTNGLPIEVAQATHRINILNAWSAIHHGSKVLEIGCGQGNCTAVLAEAVGPTGHVDALDPAPPEYGSPFTLAQAQGHISQSQVGDRVTWHRATPEAFLADQGERRWDVVVLTHCIWYFQSPNVLSNILQALRGRVDKICIAEYALRATKHTAVPHVLAALARGMLEAHKSQSSQNIQTLLSPESIGQVAEQEGWMPCAKTFLIPGEALLDGSWEVGSVISDTFLGEIEQSIDDERVKVVLKSARASTLAAVESVGGVKMIQTMDVWTGVYSLNSASR